MKKYFTLFSQVDKLCGVVSSFNPACAVAIYYGLQILAATLVYCSETPVILMGSQR